MASSLPYPWSETGPQFSEILPFLWASSVGDLFSKLTSIRALKTLFPSVYTDYQSTIITRWSVPTSQDVLVQFTQAELGGYFIISCSHVMKENVVLEFVWECLEIVAPRLTFNRLSELIVHLLRRNKPPGNIFTRPNCFPIRMSLSSHASNAGWGFNYYVGRVRS